MNRTFGLAFLFSLVATSGYAQTTLHGGTILNGNDSAPANVTFDKGTISAVGSQKTGELIDVSGKVVTAGFIDPHTILGLVEIWAVDSTRDYEAGTVGLQKDFIQAAFRASDGFNPNAVAIPIAREGGVTSVVVVPSGGIVSGQSAWVDLRSEVPNFESAIVSDSIGLTATLGESANRTIKGSRGAAVLRLRETLDDAAQYKNAPAKFDQKRTEDNAVSRLDLDALSKVLGTEKPVVVSVDRAQDILNVVELAKTFKLRVIIAGAAEGWMVAKQLAEAKVPVIVDPFGNVPYSFDSLGARGDNAALLDAAGVTVMLSTFDGHNVRNLRFAAGNAVRAGMPYDAAIRAVTSNVAEAFGMADYGLLAKGKVANIVVWSGDPFQPSSRVERMFVGGKEVNLDNRQKALFRRYRTLKRRAEPAAQTETTKE